MGKKLDALLGRTFKASKFKPLVGLSISRLAVLKHQRQARSKQSLSDVLQLLQLGHRERALLRAEHAIKEQNMLDVYDMIEGYCNLLIERVHLIEQQRECHEELKEAVSGLLYAASRCGDFPELQEIRAVLTSHFGKEFAARAIELRNNCGVNPEMIKRLSTRMPSLEQRMKVLKEIASENNIVLQLEEGSSVSVEEQLNITKQNQPKPDSQVEETLHALPELRKDEEFPDPLTKAKQKYKGVADAAQAAYESAAYAAAAARAAMELSKSEPHDPDDQDISSNQATNVFNTHDFMKGMSQSEGEEITNEHKGEEFNRDAEELEKPAFAQNSNSGEDILKESTTFVDAESESEPFGKELVFDESDETHDKQNSRQFAMQEYHAGSPPHLELEKKPFSVRTRRM